MHSSTHLHSILPHTLQSALTRNNRQTRARYMLCYVFVFAWGGESEIGSCMKGYLFCFYTAIMICLIMFASLLCCAHKVHLIWMLLLLLRLLFLDSVTVHTFNFIVSCVYSLMFISSSLNSLTHILSISFKIICVTDALKSLKLTEVCNLSAVLLSVGFGRL